MFLKRFEANQLSDQKARSNCKILAKKVNEVDFVCGACWNFTDFVQTKRGIQFGESDESDEKEANKKSKLFCSQHIETK